MHREEQQRILSSVGFEVQSFLVQDAWPKRPADMNANIDTDPEVKGPVVCATYVSDPNPLKEMIERYSSWDRLRRIVGWTLRYKTNLLRNVKRGREGETIAYESIGQVTPIEVDEILRQPNLRQPSFGVNNLQLVWFGILNERSEQSNLNDKINE